MKKRAWNVLSFAFCTMVAGFLLMALGLKTTAAVASSESGPGMRTLGNISDQYTPEKFDHPKHVVIAGSCAMCHHQHQDIKKLNCMGCHSIAPSTFKNSVKSNFTACSARRGAPNANSPSVPGLKVAYHQQCFQCHRGFLPI
jgi:uncharacterized membrane protein